MKDVLLVDLSSIFHRHWHVSKDEPVSSAASGTLKEVLSLVSEYDHVGICGDWGPYDRKEMFPAYKQHRDKPEAALIDQLRKTQEKLKAEGFTLLAKKGKEADDIIATIANQLQGECRVTIASGDKDLMQLIGPNVIMRNKGELIDVAVVEERFGVLPSQMLDYLSLMGDSIDNVPGVKGVAKKHSRELISKYSDIEGVFRAVKECPEDFFLQTGKPSKVFENLVAGEEAARMAKALISLQTEVDIDYSSIFEPRMPVPIETGEGMNQDARLGTAASDAPLVEAEVVEQSEAVVVRPSRVVDVEYRRQLEPTSMADGSNNAWALANTIYESRVFAAWPNPGAIIAVLLKGRCMGLDSITSMQSFDCLDIKGRLTIAPKAVTLAAIVKSSELCEYWQVVETTESKCVIETKHVKDKKPTLFTYTLKQAERAGLTGKAQWKMRPDTMLRHRCASECARMVYPELVMGIHTSEEMRDAES